MGGNIFTYILQFDMTWFYNLFIRYVPDETIAQIKKKNDIKGQRSTTHLFLEWMCYMCCLGEDYRGAQGN